LSIKIENLENNLTDTLDELSEDITMTIFERMGMDPTNMISTDISFEPDTEDSLRELLGDMGVSLSDFDSSVFDTEGTAVP